MNLNNTIFKSGFSDSTRKDSRGSGGGNSLSLRAFYGKDDRGNIVGQNLNINGHSLHFSQQQIVPSMHRQSQFKNGRIQIITVPGTTTTTIPSVINSLL